jgi:GNAT superfamily N-acetyltransferase
MEATNLRIRIAGAGDAEMIADLARRTFYETFAAVNTEENMRIYLEEQYTREKAIAEVVAPGRIYVLAYLGDEVAGYASLRESDPPKGLEGEKTIELGQLYAEQKLIGKGVGAFLMQACLDIAKERGRDWVWLGVWTENHRAKAFYSKWGFEPFGEHIFFVGLDAQTDWWMRKRL